MKYLALTKNEVDPSAPIGELAGWYPDIDSARRARAGDVLAEVVIDVSAIKSKEATSFLRREDGRWIAVSYYAAISYCHGRYDVSLVIQTICQR